MFKEKNFHIDFCYSSPALRCVQTAMKILEGLQLNQQIKIRFGFCFSSKFFVQRLFLFLVQRIESGLFECTGWYPNVPNFLTKKELLENKYPIEKNYYQYVELSPSETEVELYHRNNLVTKSIVESHENDENPQILFVGQTNFDDKNFVESIV